MARVCGALRISRSTAYRTSSGRPPFYRRKDDPKVLAQIRSVTRKRATYGHRRVTVLVNRACETHYNRKRIRRVMRMNGLQLPPNRRRRNGRPHPGVNYPFTVAEVIALVQAGDVDPLAAANDADCVI